MFFRLIYYMSYIESGPLTKWAHVALELLYYIFCGVVPRSNLCTGMTQGGIGRYYKLVGFVF